MTDNRQELFPITDADGHILGKITRGEAHSGSRVLHPVVHLHVFNSRGELFLQQRPLWKDIQPGKWDTAVGGHIDYSECLDSDGNVKAELGDSIITALRREVREELGITDFQPIIMGHYVFEGPRERELVYVHRTVYDGPIRPSSDELDGGKFWTYDELQAAIGTGVLTPNFEDEYQRLLQRQHQQAACGSRQ